MLVLFDIDGTLTQTNALDATLFARAFVDTFRVELPTLDWTAYRDVSDRGVAEEGALRALGRRARPDEIAAMRERFLTSLRRALGEHEGKLEVPGAAAIVRTLREEGRTVALATGCWDASARLKLAHAEIDVTGLTLASSDDEPDRARIMGAAIEASGAVVGRDPIVYVGDGPVGRRRRAARRRGLRRHRRPRHGAPRPRRSVRDPPRFRGRERVLRRPREGAPAHAIALDGVRSGGREVIEPVPVPVPEDGHERANEHPLVLGHVHGCFSATAA